MAIKVKYLRNKLLLHVSSHLKRTYSGNEFEMTRWTTNLVKIGSVGLLDFRP